MQDAYVQSSMRKIYEAVGVVVKLSVSTQPAAVHVFARRSHVDRLEGGPT